MDIRYKVAGRKQMLKKKETNSLVTFIELICL